MGQGEEIMDKRNKTIYVMLSDTGTLFTRAIKWFTNAPYNHASLVFDENLDEIYSFGRKKPKNPLFAGFVREDVYQGTYCHFQNTRCLILKIHVSEQEYYNIRGLVQYFDKNKELYSYNLVGLFGVLFNHPIGRKNSYFCSQFVADVFQKSGIALWNLPSALVTPNDFIKHPSFEMIYEGKLYDYPLLNDELLPLGMSKSRLAMLYSPVTALKKLLPY